LVTRYLGLCKAKKWAEVRKLIHPSTLQAIAERKKRLGKEDHPMAAWFQEKTEYYVKDFKVTAAKPGKLGTFIVETAEDNFHVQEKAMAEQEPASYLVGRKGGTWFVVDKKRGETFSDDAIKFGYKGYFDPTPAEPTSREEE
jgi:hypothetical protein